MKHINYKLKKKLKRYDTGDPPGDGQSILETAVLNTRPFMTEDYFYRLNKTNPGTNIETILNLYDNAHYTYLPKRDEYNEVIDIVAPGNAAFYAPAITEQLMKIENIRANRNGYKNPFSTLHSILAFGDGTTKSPSVLQTIAHEFGHMYDAELPDEYKITLESKQTLMDAYPEFVLNLPNKENYITEASSTNRELRKKISEMHGGVMNEELDKVIDEMPNEELYKLYTTQNGYTQEHDYYNPKKILEFYDYQKTPEYNNVYIPLKGYYNALRSAQGLSQNLNPKISRPAKTKIKELNKQKKNNEIFGEGVTLEQIDRAEQMYEKFQHEALLEHQKRKLNDERMNYMKKALKEVAMNNAGANDEVYFADKGKSIRKCDIGTKPIGSGFLRNDDLILLGYTTQQAAPITNSFVPEAKALAILFGASKVLPFAQTAYKTISAYTGAINAAKQAASHAAQNAALSSATSGLANGASVGLNVFPGIAVEATTDASLGAGSGVATNAGVKAAGNAAASKALGAANVAMNAYSAVKGTVDTLKNWSDSSTLTAGDLYNSAQQNTEYVNGVAYNTMGGIDDKGFNDYVRAQNKANTIGGAMSGAEAGMGIGGLVGLVGGPLGSLIGSGIGGLVGGLVGAFGGHKARERRRRLMEEAKRNYMLAANAQNTQNYSDAMTQSMQNDYHATHGDKGITKCDNGVALVNDREVTGNAYKDESGNLRIADAHTVNSPYGRADVKLENVKADSGFVIGHKIDKDGIELNEKARVYEKMFNSGIPQLRNIGEQGLLLLLNVQPHIKDNNPKPQYAKDIEKAANGMPMADKGKSINNMKTRKYLSYLPMFDKGMDGAQYPLMSYLGNYLANKAMQKEVRNSKVYAYNPYTPSNGELAVNMMPTQYDITPQKQALYGALRHGLYNVDQDGTASAGMRQARKNNLFNNYMRGIAGLMSEKFNKENEMMSNKAKLMYQALSDEATRRYQGNAQYYDQLVKGYGQRNNQLMALKATMPKDFDRLMQNLSNIRYQNKYLDMVYQDLTRDQKNSLAKK